MLLCNRQLCEEFTGGGFSSQNGFPSQRVSKLESVSHVNVAIVTFTLIILYLSMELWDLQASEVDVGVNGITQLGDWCMNIQSLALRARDSVFHRPMPSRYIVPHMIISQQTYDAMITSLSRQNDIMTSFWRNNDVIVALYVRWDSNSFITLERFV